MADYETDNEEENEYDRAINHDKNKKQKKEDDDDKYLVNKPIRAFETNNLYKLYFGITTHPSLISEWFSILWNDSLFQRTKASFMVTLQTLTLIWVPLLVGTYLGFAISGTGMDDFLNLFKKAFWDEMVNPDVNHHPLSKLFILKGTEAYINKHERYHQYWKTNYIDGFEYPIRDYEVLINGLRHFLKSQDIDYQEILSTPMSDSSHISIKHIFITYALTMIFYIAMPFILTYRIILGIISGFLLNADNKLFSPSSNTPVSEEKGGPGIPFPPLIILNKIKGGLKFAIFWVIGVLISLFHFGVTWGTLYNSLLILTLGFTICAVFVYHAFNFFIKWRSIGKITAKITFKYLWLMIFLFFAMTQSMITPFWSGENAGTFVKILLGVFTILSARKYWNDEGNLMKEQYGNN